MLSFLQPVLQKPWYRPYASTLRMTEVAIDNGTVGWTRVVWDVHDKTPCGSVPCHTKSVVVLGDNAIPTSGKPEPAVPTTPPLQ